MSETQAVQISVIVPAYNEQERLKSSLPHLWKSLKRRYDCFEIIVVDDGSSDGTAAVVSMFSTANPEIRLLRYEGNRGKGYAVRTGVLAAAGKLILFSDADLSTPIREVGKLTRAIQEGFDIAIGSRARRESRIIEYQPVYRVLMGKMFNKIVRLLAVSGISDTQCGFKCFKREVARDIFTRCRIEGFSFDVEVLCIAQRMGFKVKEIGVLWRNDLRSTVHPIRHSLQMLQELALIRWNVLSGRYNEPAAMCLKLEV